MTFQRKMKDKEDPVQDEDNLEDEALDESEESSCQVYDKFANVSIRGPICAETVNPVIDFIIGVNLSTDEDLDLQVINLFIDTEGGDLHAAVRLIDVIQMSEIPVRTIGWGKVASAGLMIFMTGKERFISEYCSILSHNATFSASKFSIRVKDTSHQQEFKLIIDRIMRIYKRYTKKDEKYIRKNLLKDNDVYMSAEEAIEHGLADALLPQGTQWLKDLVFTKPSMDEESLDNG